MSEYIKCAACGAVNRAETKAGERPICGKCKNPLNLKNATADRPVPVSDADFGQQVLSAEVPVLVDFFASWCGACRTVEPALDAIAQKYKGKLKVAKLDVEQSPENARRYKIRATPTLIVFQKGQAAEQVEGALPERQLEQLVEKHVA